MESQTPQQIDYVMQEGLSLYLAQTHVQSKPLINISWSLQGAAYASQHSSSVLQYPKCFYVYYHIST